MIEAPMSISRDENKLTIVIDLDNIQKLFPYDEDLGKAVIESCAQFKMEREETKDKE